MKYYPLLTHPQFWLSPPCHALSLWNLSKTPAGQTQTKQILFHTFLIFLSVSPSQNWLSGWDQSNFTYDWKHDAVQYSTEHMAGYLLQWKQQLIQIFTSLILSCNLTGCLIMYHGIVGFCDNIIFIASSCRGWWFQLNNYV